MSPDPHPWPQKGDARLWYKNLHGRRSGNTQNVKGISNFLAYWRKIIKPTTRRMHSKRHTTIQAFRNIQRSACTRQEQTHFWQTDFLHKAAQTRVLTGKCGVFRARMGVTIAGTWNYLQRMDLWCLDVGLFRKEQTLKAAKARETEKRLSTRWPKSPVQLLETGAWDFFKRWIGPKISTAYYQHFFHKKTQKLRLFYQSVTVQKLNFSLFRPIWFHFSPALVLKTALFDTMWRKTTNCLRFMVSTMLKWVSYWNMQYCKFFYKLCSP